MLTYQGNPQTIHFVNFVLHSGNADPAELVRKAREEAGKGLTKRRRDPEELAETTAENLVELLQEALVEWSEGFAPSFEYDMGIDGPFTGFPSNYDGTDENGLMAPLLGLALAEISLPQAAKLILEHVNKAA